MLIQADQIREHITVRHFPPARQRREQIVVVVAGDVHREMALKDRVPNVCQVLRGKKLRKTANVTLLSWGGPHAGCTTTFRFHLD